MLLDLTSGNSFLIAGSVSNTSGIGAGNTGQACTTTGAWTAAGANYWDYGGSNFAGGEDAAFLEIVNVVPFAGVSASAATVQFRVEDNYDSSNPPLWDALKVYAVGEVVLFNGKIYCCSVITTVGQSPITTPTSWNAAIPASGSPAFATWRDIVYSRTLNFGVNFAGGQESSLNMAGKTMWTFAIPPIGRRYYRLAYFVTTATSCTAGSVLAYIKVFN